MRSEAINKVSKISFYFILALYFIKMYNSNLILSESFEILDFREIDDTAFQMTLRKIHELWSNFKFTDSIKIIDYGYGNLFWILYSLITYPFYLLGYEKISILLPRQTSALQFIISIYFLNKTYLIISNDTFKSNLISIMSLLMPSIIYASQRFHNHGLITLMSSFLIFLIIKEYQDENLHWKRIFFLTGIVVGIKLTGVFLIPFVGLVYYFKEGKLAIFRKINFYIYILIFLVGFSLALSPLTIIYPFFKIEAISIFKTLYSYFIFSNTNYGSLENIEPYSLLINGFCTLLFSSIFICILYFLWIRQILTKDINKSIYISYFISLNFAAFYLLFKTAQGPWAISNYILPMAIFFPAPLVMINTVSVFKKILLLLFCTIMIYLNKVNIKDAFLIYQNKLKDESVHNLIENFNDLKLIFHPKLCPITILKDYRIPIPLSEFRGNCKILYVFDNFDKFENYTDIDYIIIYKRSTIFNSLIEIDKFGNKEEIINNKSIIEKLLYKGIFFENNYKKIYNKNDVIVFRKVKNQ